MDNVEFIKVAEKLSFPEGPAWDGKGNLIISNCYGDWLTLVSESGQEIFVAAPTSPTEFVSTNGLVFNSSGELYACDYKKGAILKFSPEGKCDMVAEGYQGQKFNRPNDLAFDPSGNLFFTDPKSYNPDTLDGRIFVLERESNTVKLVYEGLAFPNGIAFSLDGESLYICESAKQRILKFPVNKNLSLGNYEVLVELPGGDPDGLAIDSAGNIFVAHFGGKAVYKISKEGEVLQKIETPGKKPTNLEFAGKDLRTLYITEVETNSVYKTTVDIPGSRLFFSPPGE